MRFLERKNVSMAECLNVKPTTADRLPITENSNNLQKSAKSAGKNRDGKKNIEHRE